MALSLGAKKQILVIGNDGVQLYVLNAKTISLYADFTNAGETLKDDLRQAFKQVGRSLVLLFDVVEQQYRREPIPKVSNFDKNKVILRKLNMAFPQQQMRAYLALKQAPTTGEGLVALFAALGMTPEISEIMDAVIESEVPISGAGLLPLESTNMVLELTKQAHKRYNTTTDSRWSIMITHHKTGGLRQIVIKDGELALTRMTPLVLEENYGSGMATEILREFNATLTYLSRFGYVPGSGLDLYLISTPEIGQQLKSYNLPVDNFYPLTPAEAGSLLGMNVVQNRDMTMFGEIVHAGWSGIQRKLTVPLSAPLLDKVKMARQSSRVLIAALVLGAIYFGWQIVNLQSTIVTLNGEIEAQEDQKSKLKTRLDELFKKMTALKNEPAQTQSVLNIYDVYKKKHIDIDPTITAFVPLLGENGVVLKSIEIEAIDTPADTSAPQASHSEDDMGMGGAAPTEEKKEKKQAISMKMEISYPRNTTIEEAARNTLDLAEAFRKRFPGREITIEKMVGDLALDKTVQGTSEQVAQGKVEGRKVKEETSTLIFKGEME